MPSPRIQALRNDIQRFGRDALRIFWEEIERRHTPIIEPGPEGYSLVTFVWREEGSARHVAVIQDFGADGIREHQMARLPDSDVWYLTRLMPSDTRTTYQLSPSSSEDPSEAAPYQLDPFNPKRFPGFLSESGDDIYFSLLELPNAPGLPWRETRSTRAGTVRLHRPFSDQRRMWAYMPSISVTDSLPVLVVFDGRIYKDLLKLPEMLDTLIEQKQIPPVAALLIDSRDRSELLCRPEFADYVTNKILPWLRSTYPISVDPLQTTIVGSSFGGLAAAFLAFRYPNVWGTVLSQTGWFRWHPEEDPEYHWLTRQLAVTPKLPVRFWLQVGSLEVARMRDDGPSQLAANQYLRDILQTRGYAVSYYEYSGGHDVSSLEFPLAQALTEILK